MKTLMVGTIMILFVVNAFETVHEKRSLEWTRENQSLLRWAFGGTARARQDNDDTHPSLDDFYKCVQEYGATDDDLEEYFSNPTTSNASHLMQCIAGCYFEWTQLLVNKELDKERLKGLLHAFGVGSDVASYAASDCQANIAEVPRESCDLGTAVQGCLTKLLSQLDVGVKRFDPKTRSASSSALQRKNKHASRRGRK